MASGRDPVSGAPPEDHLTLHLKAWLGAWPPSGDLEVIGSTARDAPAWDGTRHRLVGVVRPDAGVVSVPPRARERVARRTSGMPDLDDPRWRRAVADLLDAPDQVVGIGVFRVITTDAEVAAYPDAGRWVDAADARVPTWLRPFNAPQVLLAEDDRGGIVGGVGIKLHDRYGAEVAVVVDRSARDRGLGRGLVSQATRRVLAGGRVVSYLHDPDNVASARLADAVGFRDRGWRVLGLFPRSGSRDPADAAPGPENALRHLRPLSPGCHEPLSSEVHLLLEADAARSVAEEPITKDAHHEAHLPLAHPDRHRHHRRRRRRRVRSDRRPRRPDPGARPDRARRRRRCHRGAPGP